MKVNAPDEPSLSIVINGKVVQWTQGDSLNIIVGRLSYREGDKEYYCTAKIKGDGSFSLVLPQPPEVLLSAYDAQFSDPDSLRTICVFTLSVHYPSGRFDDKSLDNGNVSWAEFNSDSAKAGAFEIFWMYADRDFHLTREYTASMGLMSSIDRYDLHLKKGWNRIMRMLTKNESHLRVTEASVNDEAIGNWYFER